MIVYYNYFIVGLFLGLFAYITYYMKVQTDYMKKMYDFQSQIHLVYLENAHYENRLYRAKILEMEKKNNE